MLPVPLPVRDGEGLALGERVPDRVADMQPLTVALRED